MKNIFRKSNLAKAILFFFTLSNSACYSAEANSGDQDSTTIHGSEDKSDDEHIKNTVKKNADIYEHVRAGEAMHVIRKSNRNEKSKVLTIGGTDGIPLGHNPGHLPLDPRWTYLVDISETDNQLKLLFRCAQTFVYAEFYRNYPKIDIPKGNLLIKLNDQFDTHYWKPHFYVNFIPNGFFKEEADIERFDAKLSENGRIKITSKSGIIDEYNFNRDSLELHGERISDLRIWRSHKLESEIVENINELMAGSDLRWKSRLLTLIEDKCIDEQGNLQGWERHVISSIRDRALATTYENRIRSDYLKMKNTRD